MDLVALAAVAHGAAMARNDKWRSQRTQLRHHGHGFWVGIEQAVMQIIGASSTVHAV
jgi:hypothetical protein